MKHADAAARRRMLRLALATLLFGGVLSLVPLPELREVPVYELATVEVSLRPATPAGADGEVAQAGADPAGPDPADQPPPEADADELPQESLDLIAERPERWEGGDGDVGEFTTIGVRLDAAPAGPVLVRTENDGTWGEWRPLHIDGATGPDPASAEAGRAASEVVSQPLWIGEADGFEINVSPDVSDEQVEVLVVQEVGTELEAVQPTAGADALPGMPGIRTRSAWSAAPPAVSPTYNSTVKLALVHHSVTGNTYSQAEVPGIIRSIQTFHMQGNGWDDIAYNFVVDKFGTVWEGRGGGIDRAVQGGHSKGFNLNSVGVVVLGDYTQVAPSTASVNSVGQVMGWKLRLHGNDPLNPISYTSNGNDRYPAGTVVNFPTRIVGHGDTNLTGCPGQHLTAQLGNIRNQAKARFDLASNPFGSLDEVVFVGAGTVRLRGWAIDPDTTGPVTVHVSIDGAVAPVSAGEWRPDVGDAYPSYGSSHGYSATFANRTPGWHRVCASALNHGNGTIASVGWCSDVFVPSGAPLGNFELLRFSGPREVLVKGWAADPDTSAAIDVHLNVDGAILPVRADQNRPDVGAAYPGFGPNHGFQARVGNLAPGRHRICVNAINVGGADVNTSLGCAELDIPTGSPWGSYESLTVAGPGQVRARGWAADPDQAGPIGVELRSAGSVVATDVADDPRADVGSAYPGWGPNHGFSTTATVGVGSRQICTYAHNAGPTAPHTALGCATVQVPTGNPVGAFESITSPGSGQIRVRGWALDPDTAASLTMHVYIDGFPVGTTANVTRNDLPAAWAGWGTQHGFDGTATGQPPGMHTVCVFAINQGPGDQNTSLGCAQVQTT